ncbi:hypothetical protein P2G88_01435 [Aliiglaciecola sp. CAU 1673]|uniref:hypothetical protein n=1 Tax=Aliiglaciecola sp. CAU 1673 TaxID=3032595 RepID=UPI0023DA8A1C|nr:hypothetical protein [Aliiglaciecola sp. CAU 1673]MDF2176914.1 hypothetical protein [Aliiglaciecola sp. CAU 1673]
MELKHIALFGSLTVLVACGGGGGETAANAPVSGGGGATTPPPAPQLILETVQYNSCDIESPLADVDVVIHDAQGAIIKTLKTDSQGKLATDWPANAAHVTTVGKFIYNSEETTDINTVLNTGAVDLGIQRYPNFDDSTGCNCHEVTLTTENLVGIYNEYKVLSDGREVGVSNVSELVREVCGAEQEVDVLLKSPTGIEVLAGKVSVEGQTRISLKPEDFTATGVPVNAWLGEEPEYIEYAMWDSITHESDRMQWRQYSYNGVSPDGIHVFPALSDKTFLRFYSSGWFMVEDVSVRVNTNTIKRTDANGDAGEFLPITPNQTLSDSLFQLGQGISEGGFSEYDFSGAYEDLGKLNIWYRAIHSTGGEIGWYIHAPTKGNIPDLRLPEELESRLESSEPKSITTTLRGYGSPISYAEVLKKTAEASKAESWYDTDIYNQYRTLSLRVSL